MPSQRILHFGLTGPPNPQMIAAGMTSEGVLKSVREGADRARQAGYEVQLTFFEPEDFTAALAGVRAELETGRWDALVLGGGIRLAAPLTPLFERAVNMAVEVVRSKGLQLKVLFQAAPGDILETVQRGFGEGV